MLSPFAHNNGIRSVLIYCFNSQEKDSVNNDTNVNSYKKIFLTSETGNDIIASYDYFPYGKKIELAHTSEGAVTQTFTGKELDRYDEDMDIGADGEGWYYFGARYYDADIGMWASCDPKAQFWSLYSYTGNGINPLIGTDPDGNKLIFALGVSNQFKNEFARTIQYLNKHGAAGTVAKLDARKEEVTIYETSGGSGFSYKDNAILWNPHLGFNVRSSGNGVSPAIGFVHEAGHALDYLEDPSNYPIRRLLPAGDDNNLVERDALRKHELPAAIKTGEGQRKSYYDVQSAKKVNFSDQN